MNVLITGSSGFLGHNLIKTIKQEKQDWTIFGIDIKSSGNQEINFINIDLLEKVSWGDILKENNIDLIFHLTGVFHNIDNYSMMKINVLQTLSFFEEIRKTDQNTKILLIGSAAQYGRVDTKDLPITEDFIQNPTSFYGLTKKWQEEIALNYSTKYGIKSICTRPSNFIGPGIAQILLPGYLTKVFSENKDLINIKISSKNDERDYIDAKDVCSALIKLSEEQKCYGEIFNISSSELISNEKLIHLFAEIRKRNVNIEETNKNNNSKISLSNKKLKDYTNWEKQYNIKDSIKWCFE
ncbi:MAG: NAD(P)-dependent oxidoreductase [Candidatus Heimdallarchaeota archaeon]